MSSAEPEQARLGVGQQVHLLASSQGVLREGQDRLQASADGHELGCCAAAGQSRRGRHLQGPLLAVEVDPHSSSARGVTPSG